MNEQKKELMLRFAVENKGVWPDDRYISVLVATKCNVNYPQDSFYVCSATDDHHYCKSSWDFGFLRTEFEAFIGSLFEGAPEDAEYYLTPSARTYPAWIKGLNNGECKYKVIISTNLQEYTDKDWCSLNSDMVLRSGSLIPRPRKKPSFIGDAIRRSIDQAYNEAIKKAPNTPTMNDDVTDTNVGEWNGAGLPPVGTVCNIQLAFTGYEDCEITYIGDGVYCFRYKCTEYTGSIYDTVFRPVKTEAEKERERLTSEAIEIALGVLLVTDKKTIAPIEIADAFIEAGWRPSKD